MKYASGDVLLFKIDDALSLSGIVLHSPNQSGKYVIVLWDGADLFAQEFGMDGQSFFMLETILMDSAYVDAHAAVSVVSQVPLTTLVAHGEFVEIGSLEQLKAYYEQETHLRATPQEPLPGGLIKRKCLRNIQDVLAEIKPPNEFPTVRLYRAFDNDWYFWQLFCHGEDSYHLVENWGMIGGTVAYNELKDLSKEQAREAYDLAVRRKEEEGFMQMKPPEGMILQFTATDGWGSMEDLDFRHKMEEHLDRYLYWSGNGAVNGGDIGSGSLNIFFDVISPAAAVQTVLEALAVEKVERPFLIVHEVRKEGEKTEFEVVYPEGHEGQFCY